MHINKYNSCTQIKGDEIKNECNEFTTRGAKCDQNSNVCVHIHNNVHIFYSNIDNLCSIDNALHASNNLRGVCSFHKNKSSSNDGRNVSKININTCKKFSSKNGVGERHNIKDMDSSYYMGGAQYMVGTNCVLNSTHKHLINSNFPNNVKVFNRSNNYEHNVCYNNRVSENFNCSNIHEKKYIPTKNYSFNGQQSAKVNTESNCQTPIFEDKVYHLNSRYNNERVPILKEDSNNETHVEGSHKNSLYKIGNNDINYSVHPSNYCHHENSNTFLESRNENNALSYNGNIDTFISGEYDNYATRSSKDSSNVARDKNVKERGSIPHEFAENGSIQTNFAKYGRMLHKISKDENNEEQNIVNEWAKTITFGEKKEVKKCQNIKKLNKNGVTPEQIDEEKIHKNNMNSLGNNSKTKEKMLTFNEQLIKNNVNFTCASHYIAINKKKSVQDKKNVLKSDTKLIEENSCTSEVNENITNNNSVLNIYECNNLCNNSMCNIYENKNNMKKCVNNFNQNYKQYYEQMSSLDNKICNNYNVMNLKRHTTKRDEQKNCSLTVRDSCNKQNLAIKQKEYFPVEKSGKSEGDFYINGHNLRNIFKKNISSPSTFDCYEKDVQNTFTKSAVCKINYPHKDSKYKYSIYESNDNNNIKSACIEKNCTNMDIIKKSTACNQISSNNTLNNVHVNKQIKVIFQECKPSDHNFHEDIINFANGNSVNEINCTLPNNVHMEIERENVEGNESSPTVTKYQYIQNNFNQIKYDTVSFIRHDKDILTVNIEEYFLQDKCNNFSCKRFNVEQIGNNNFAKAQRKELFEFLEIYDKNEITEKPRENKIGQLVEIYDTNKCTIKNEENQQDEFLEIYNNIIHARENQKSKKADEFAEIYNKTEQEKSGEVDDFADMHDKTEDNKNSEVDEFAEMHEKTEDKKNKEVDEFVEIYEQMKSARENDKIKETDDFAEMHDKTEDNKNSEVDEFAEMHEKTEDKKNKEVDEFVEIYEQMKSARENEKIKETDNFADIYDNMRENRENEKSKETVQFAEVYDNTEDNKSKEVDEFAEIYEHMKNSEKNQKSKEADEFTEIYDKTEKNKSREVDEFAEIHAQMRSAVENPKSIEAEDLAKFYYKTENNKSQEMDEFAEIYEQMKSAREDQKSREVDEFAEIYEQMRSSKERGKDEVLSADNYRSNEDYKKKAILKVFNHDHDNDDTRTDRQKCNSSFVYASGKKVNINKDVLKQMRDKLFSDDDKDFYPRSVDKSGKLNTSFSYMSVEENSINKNILKDERKIESVDKNYASNKSTILQEENEVNVLPFFTKNEFINISNKENKSFTYASGKKVNINKDVLKEMKGKLFDDNDKEDYPRSVNKRGMFNTSFSYTSDKEISIKKDILKETKGKLFDDNDKEDYPRSVNKSEHSTSFTYASGKEISINKDVLKRMRDKLFSDDDKDAYPRNVNKNELSSSFTYASGKDISVNKDVLKRMRDKLFSDYDKDAYPRNVNKNELSSSFTYASGKDISVNKDVLKRMRDKLFSDDDSYNNSYENNIKKKIKTEKDSLQHSSLSQYTQGRKVETYKNEIMCKEEKNALLSDHKFAYPKRINQENVKNVSDYEYFSNKKGNIGEKFSEDDGIDHSCSSSRSHPKCDIKKGLEEKLPVSNNEDIQEVDNAKEQEAYESEGYGELMKKDVHLRKKEKDSDSVYSGDNDILRKIEMAKKLNYNSKSKSNFINPRKRKTNKEMNEKKIIEINDKELNLNINLRNHLKLIRNTFIHLSQKKRLKNSKILNNTLIFINEKKKPYKLNWFNYDYTYFLKNEEKNEYYTFTINEMYELFMLITKQLGIFHSYDFIWFSKKYNLITMSLIRKYIKELKRKYRCVKNETITSSKKTLSHLNDVVNKEEYSDVFTHDGFNEQKNNVLKKIKTEDANNSDMQSEKEDGICNKDNIYIYEEKRNIKEETYTNARLCNKLVKCDESEESSKTKSECINRSIGGEVDGGIGRGINAWEREEGKKKRIISRRMEVLEIIDEVQPPCPIEFMFKLLKRYIEERKNKKGILQLIQENTLSYKVPVNLRVEKVIWKEGEDGEGFILILSDNFDYVYCIIKDSHLKKLLISGKIKEGNILKINSLDLCNKMQEENENINLNFIMRFSLSSNNLVDIDQKDQLKIGLSKYKAKRIKNIQDFGNGCFFIDVIIISKSDFSYGFYDQTKKKFLLLNRDVYEKIVYNLKNEMAKMLHKDNFQENSKYKKLKNELYMFLEATPLCTVQAIDFASSEKIKENLSLVNKVEHIINSLCQVKMFKINNETYENIRKGSRIQFFNVHVQKSNRNNKFTPLSSEHVLDDFLYDTFQGSKKCNYLKGPLNYDIFSSYFVEEDSQKDRIQHTSDYDHYLKCFNRGVLKKKAYTPIVFQATHTTYINVDAKYKSKLFEELYNILTIRNYEQINEDKNVNEGREIKKVYPSFIYTNVFKIPVLSVIHMNMLKECLKLNGDSKHLCFDLIQGNLYNLSGIIIHYTDIETKEVVDYKCAEDKKNIMCYKIFLLTSNGNLCCINISMVTSDSLISFYKKDFECKEREILRRMVHVENYVDAKEKETNKFKNDKGKDNNNSKGGMNYRNHNDLFKYLYKSERTDDEACSNLKEGMLFKNVDVFIFFKDVEFINYDEKYDIFNFRSFYHPNFHVLRSYSSEFEKMKGSITQLIRENYITLEKNKLVITLKDNCKIKIDKANVPYMHFLYLLIYSKCKSIELTGVSLKNNYLSGFLKNIRNVFVK
ncbi:conserved Plasmodium protein, unknown function [Plasmodium ovale wallikeri]|uniref:Uncharacterized protein n=1 Tax=Plasmodium ovale wallikeri TaxID=864142 RepID=A0A1A8ZCD2_PLAOA|nr:conserved Plasmodium protein, unknown function [Plasmodium ovale wallikeri]